MPIAFSLVFFTQVIFRMTTTLLKFGFVMVVVMVGFAMALHVLFRDLDRFGQTFLALFRAMLGDTDFFEVVSGSQYDGVATFLLVVYLFIVTIMLLNLLVAILSTSHAQVQDNASTELKVSKARIIAHRWVVDNDLLPAPFNLLQLTVSLVVVLLACLWNATSCVRRGGLRGLIGADGFFGADGLYLRASGAVGRVVFWLILGPVAVGGGALLWITSSFPFAQYAWYAQYKEEKNKTATIGLSPGSIILRWVLIFLWCIIVAPIYLLWLWITGCGRVLLPCCFNKKTAGGSVVQTRVKSPTIESLLLSKPGGGVGADKLREFLEDPMNDDDVRQDEKDRPTMVEHIKLLRNRLETTSAKKIEELQKDAVPKRDFEEVRCDVKDIRDQLRMVVDRFM